MAKTRGAACFFLLALQLPLALWRAPAATITNYLSRDGVQYWLNINVGDTVVWVNQQPLFLGTNFVESYGGEWSSPPMVNVGDSFSFTFTNTGFYAYRTGVSGYGGTKGLPGTVTVNGWTGAPPAVTILTPLDGSFFSPNTLQVVQAWATNMDNITQMQYFAGTNLIGIGTAGANLPFSPQYAAAWSNLPQGQYALVAKAIDNAGVVTSSQPVTITIVPYYAVWGARRLPTGEMLFFYDAIPVQNMLVEGFDNLWLTRTVLGAYVRSPGVFVDETVRQAPVASRFYLMGFGR